MIVRITNKCNMGCAHCFIKTCKDDSKHMDFNTLNHLCNYIEDVTPAVILISGGEPSEHPYFIQIIDRLLELVRGKSKLIVASNGKFLEDRALTEELCKRDIMIQITNDSRYYPKRIKGLENLSIDGSKMEYVKSIQPLYPLGKAVGLPGDMGKYVGPKCYNVRSIVKSNKVSSMKEVVKIMEYDLLKVCYLSIDFDGTVRGGESDFCYSLGNISEGPNVIFKNIKKMSIDSCNSCGLLDKMPQIYKEVIR